MATKQQVPVLAARLVEFQEEFSNLSTEEAQWAIMHGKEVAALCVKAIKASVANVLSPIISTFTVSEMTEKFIAKDNFQVSTSNEAKVKISNLGDSFKEWFLNKIEDPFTGSTIRGRELERDSEDGPIINALGGNDKAAITLSELFAMMAAQPKGEDGILLNNNRANIFFIPDIESTLRVVSVCWTDNAWSVRADSTGEPYDWFVGARIFSRSNSLTLQLA